jgi:hypothetical protein
MCRKLLILVIFVVLTTPAFAQLVDTAWVRRYNGPGNGRDDAYAIAIDDSGNVCVTGNSFGLTSPDYVTIKYDPSGDERWVKRYNGPENSGDYAYAVAMDGSGNVFVTGMSIGSGTAGDYATIKHYSNGDTAWTRRYDGPGNGWDYARAIAVDDSGNVYVTGMSIANGTGPDYATIKYDSSGNELWVRRYNGPGDGWDYARAIAVDGSGNLLVTGYSVGNGTSCDYATIKYYPNGDVVPGWPKRYNGPGNDYDYARALAVDGSGNVYITGDSWGSGTAFDYATIKYDSSGNELWVERYDGSANNVDYANAITVDGSGNVYVTGQSRSSGMDFDYVTIKYYPNGDVASGWPKTYNGSGNWNDHANAIATDGSGNVYVTGLSLGTWTWYDYTTIRYDSSGNELWVRSDNGQGNFGDYACAIAVDGSDNVYVTGYSHGRISYDYATIRYYQREHNDPPGPFSLLLPPNKALTPRGVRFDWENATDPDPWDRVGYDLYLSTSYRFPLDSTTIDSDLTISEHTKILDYGTYYWKVIAKDNFGAERESDQIHYFMVTGIHLGDFNGDGSVEIGDVVFCINYLYTSGPAPHPLEVGDCNCDDVVDVGDVVYLINYLFKGGPPPGC